MIANKAQEKVIETIDGQLIVIACPGSGKTTTLVRRIHHMVADCEIDSSHILMITFTNAAAKEMKCLPRKWKNHHFGTPDSSHGSRLRN